ncbi:hypothetical protein [Kitasatospora sp. NPDC001175]|uniref:Uncharacterized protein n=1 Tax=Kitasatospora cystarginea TaxID=58350 RepID=A0ABN3E3B7_9ACTN
MPAALSDAGSAAVPDGTGPFAVAESEVTGDAESDAASGLAGTALPEGAAVLAEAFGAALTVSEADGTPEPEARAPGEEV